MKLRPLILLLGVACLARSGLSLQAADDEKKAIAIEALSRLKGMDLEANAALKNAVIKVLETTRGTPQFVQIVQDFSLKGQNAGLLEVAVKLPAEEAGITALRLVLDSGDTTLLQQTLTGKDVDSAAKLAEALGNTGDKRSVPLLLPLVSDEAREVALRKQAVRSLAQFQEGAEALLKLAREDKLAAALRFTAGAELNHVRWPALKTEAARLFPPVEGQNAQPLPPVAELLKRKGDAKHGAEVFARQEVGCANCHQVNGKGVDFAPALSEIGTKLGKDALYESILDPSAGISFGFEAFDLELKSGDSLYGIIVNETNDEVTLKDARAIPTKVKKADIVKRTQSKSSIMPAGLAMTMPVQDLVDLVEYLASLKKAATP